MTTRTVRRSGASVLSLAGLVAAGLSIPACAQEGARSASSEPAASAQVAQAAPVAEPAATPPPAPALTAEQENLVKEATKDPGLYAVFETSKGVLVAKLHHDKVPVTVANFVGLATGEMEWTDPRTGQKAVRPLYDGLKFHRCIANFMVQGGCPLGNGRGSPGYTFPDEFDKSLRHDGAGVLSMANSGPNTNGSQFFITLAATPHLNDKHSVFGRVVAGLEAAQSMVNVPMKGAENSTPVEDILLHKVRIVRTGAAAEGFDWKAAWARKDEVAAKMAVQKAEAAKTGMADLYKKLGVDPAKMQKGEQGLQWFVRAEGKGTPPSQGQTIKAHYTGYLTDGTKFDSSVDRGQPFETPIGVGRVIKGWDLAFSSMKPGEKRVLVIPSELGYGKRGAGGVIPPDATLIFDVELIEVVP